MASYGWVVGGEASCFRVVGEVIRCSWVVGVVEGAVW